MTTTYRRLLSVLQKYLSSVNAQAVLNRALRESNTRPELLAVRDIARVIPRLENGIRLFVPSERQVTLHGELEGLLTAGEVPETQTISVNTEDDISKARTLARDLAEGAGATAATTTKIATIVSELARNIVSYTPGGAIIVSIVDTSPRKLRVVASDSGRGVGNLEEILAGQYKSKTGLGKGILGVKRLANRFDIRSDQNGTRIEATVWI